MHCSTRQELGQRFDPALGTSSSSARAASITVISLRAMLTMPCDLVRATARANLGRSTSPLAKSRATDDDDIIFIRGRAAATVVLLATQNAELVTDRNACEMCFIHDATYIDFG